MDVLTSQEGVSDNMFSLLSLNDCLQTVARVYSSPKPHGSEKLNIYLSLLPILTSNSYDVETK